jgi:hypothetical protein
VLEAQTVINDWKSTSSTNGRTAASAGDHLPPSPLPPPKEQDRDNPNSHSRTDKRGSVKVSRVASSWSGACGPGPRERRTEQPLRWGARSAASARSARGRCTPTSRNLSRRRRVISTWTEVEALGAGERTAEDRPRRNPGDGA